MGNKDWELISSVVSSEMSEIAKKDNEIDFLIDSEGKYYTEFPLDHEVIKVLKDLIHNKIRSKDDDYEIYNYIDIVKKLWKDLISKSIKCLRYFDNREPFKRYVNKKPVAYGINDLSSYFEKYIEFETMLYGSNKYYRDHIIHVFRTWLLGVECLLRNNGEYITKIKINEDANINLFEKLSVWSMISLTHDLGYPLEKARQIIGKTQDMMNSFVANPSISMDLSFSGVQTNMNDFVVRFLSSKMKLINPATDSEKMFVARLQPKYYFKFQKSLENSKHGIVSSIIIYKILNYFLESDYNINEDYTFNEEEIRQFYIRREILRSIASHTCKDIYHLYMSTFSFLLIIADDCQEWGRKRISELYIKSNKEYELQNINFSFDENGGNSNYCTVSERFVLPDDETASQALLQSLRKQSLVYMEIFRDGQDTVNRDFTFTKKCEIEIECNPKIKMTVEFSIHNSETSIFLNTIEYTGNENTDGRFKLSFIKNAYNVPQDKISVEDKSGTTTVYTIPL